MFWYLLEFEEDGSLFERDRDVTISIEEDVKQKKQKSASDFTAAAAADDDDNPLSTDDKTEVWTMYGCLQSSEFQINP